MSNLQHLVQLKDGKYSALCGYHRKKRDFEGSFVVSKVDCPKCLKLIIEHSERLEARNEGFHTP